MGKPACTLREMKVHDNMVAQTQAYELSSQPMKCATNTEPTYITERLASRSGGVKLQRQG